MFTLHPEAFFAIVKPPKGAVQQNLVTREPPNFGTRQMILPVDRGLKVVDAIKNA